MILRIGSDPVIITAPHQRMIFVVQRHLPRNFRPVFLRNLCHIQLVAERTRQRHIPSGLKRSHASHRVVRAVGHMRADRGERIQQRRSLLNL